MKRMVYKKWCKGVKAFASHLVLVLISSKWKLRQTELTMQLKGHRIGQANL